MYAVAALTGYLRIYNNRHYFNDVLAGAFIGVMSARLGYYFYPKIEKYWQNRNKKSPASKGQTTIFPLPYAGAGELGLNVYWNF